MNFRIDVQWDDEARVWYVEDSNVPGLVAEAPTVEAMQALLRVRVPELLELNMPDALERHARASYEVVTHRRQELAAAC